MTTSLVTLVTQQFTQQIILTIILPEYVASC